MLDIPGAVQRSVAVGLLEHLSHSVHPDDWNQPVMYKEVLRTLNARPWPVWGFDFCNAAGYEETRASCPSCPGFRLCDPVSVEDALSLKIW